MLIGNPQVDSLSRGVVLLRQGGWLALRPGPFPIDFGLLLCPRVSFSGGADEVDFSATSNTLGSATFVGPSFLFHFCLRVPGRMRAIKNLPCVHSCLLSRPAVQFITAIIGGAAADPFGTAMRNRPSGAIS